MSSDMKAFKLPTIVGFDDIKIAAYPHPALTTIHQTYEGE